MPADEVIHPPRGYCIGIFQGINAAMVGPYATEAEARDALANAVITAVGMPEGWHQWCGAENGALVCTRQQGHPADIGHDNGSVWWPAVAPTEDTTAVDDVMALQAAVTAAPVGEVRRSFDGSVAVRTTRPVDDVDAWMITRPDGTTTGSGFLTVEDIEPLLRWKVLR